jgi:hypothetical protein
MFRFHTKQSLNRIYSCFEVLYLSGNVSVITKQVGLKLLWRCLRFEFGPGHRLSLLEFSWFSSVSPGKCLDSLFLVSTSQFVYKILYIIS